MSAPNRPFTLVATLVAKGPKEADQVVSLVTAIAKRANADAEPGTKSYRLTREVDGGLKIVVLEEQALNL
ncbi:hypothetical protein MVES_001383 [Malassezia vespertilionis]|uniref:ABM domain-containing protein n=1 Tax=Malassezia vespertilionis TaxID=2020962 RepID=A0A2N1JEG0_9BASI|nr:hypothetical protein MVES_001383 [Malassezia vespertilionis]